MAGSRSDARIKVGHLGRETRGRSWRSAVAPADLPVETWADEPNVGPDPAFRMRKRLRASPVGLEQVGLAGPGLADAPELLARGVAARGHLHGVAAAAVLPHAGPGQARGR